MTIKAGDRHGPWVSDERIDFRPLMTELQKDYRSCTFDFPGYGMSDKPANNYRYALGEDAKLIWDFVAKIVPLKDFILFSHDRGDGVVLNFLQGKASS